jgi:hypothetical protein
MKASVQHPIRFYFCSFKKNVAWYAVEPEPQKNYAAQQLGRTVRCRIVRFLEIGRSENGQHT